MAICGSARGQVVTVTAASVFRGNGPGDYICGQCANVPAVGMHAVQMTKQIRVRCGRCATVNVAVDQQPEESQ